MIQNTAANTVVMDATNSRIYSLICMLSLLEIGIRSRFDCNFLLWILSCKRTHERRIEEQHVSVYRIRIQVLSVFLQYDWYFSENVDSKCNYPFLYRTNKCIRLLIVANLDSYSRLQLTYPWHVCRKKYFSVYVY
jgi:hypothetical protein